MDGLWLENGPLRLISPDISGKNDWTIEINPFSWHKSPAYMLYIDQPVGTGLSFTKKGNYCKSDLEVDIDFHYFLVNFLQVHHESFLSPSVTSTTEPWYTMPRPLYFTGESYAGHYIPSMMDYILQRNDDGTPKNYPNGGDPWIKINLKGAAIGNGWIDPFYQYSATDVAYGTSMIDLAQKESLDAQELTCRDNLKKGLLTSSVCYGLLDNVVNDSHGHGGQTKVSIYDNRMWEYKGAPRNFPLGHKDVERYLGGWTGNAYPESMTVDYTEVLKALHAEESIGAKQRFEECTDPPYNALAGQDGLGVVDEVVRILSHADKPRLLFFNGVNDMICNHVGNERLLDNLPWKNKKAWILAKRYAWDAFPSQNNLGPSGYMKEYENLSFLKVMSSGHMVPMDVPDVALEMMRIFLFSGSFDTNAQKMSSGIPGGSAMQQCECPAQTCDCPTCTQDKCDCSSQTCNCPTCETQSQSQQNTNSNGNGPDVDGDDKEEYTSDVLKGGWFGAMVGVGSTLFVVWIRGRRERSMKGYDDSDLDSLALQNERYSDNPETEMI